MTAFYYAIGGALLVIGAAIVSVLAYRAVMDAYDRRHEDTPAESDTPLPVYPPIVDEVLTGQIVETDELGQWEPDAHPLEPAYLFAAVLYGPAGEPFRATARRELVSA